jgi:hypothetical protein
VEVAGQGAGPQPGGDRALVWPDGDAREVARQGVGPGVGDRTPVQEVAVHGTGPHPSSDRAPVRPGRGAGEIAGRGEVKQARGGTAAGSVGRSEEEGEIAGPTGVNWSFY